MAGTRENARCSSSQCARYTFPADGPRRTAATFRFARFLFSSPSSLLPAGRALLRSHEESRCAHVPATARATATDTSSSSRFTLSPDPFAVRLSSCPLGRFVAPPLGLFLLFCRLFVVGVFFDGCLRAALFQTRKTAALSPFSRPRLIDDGYLREEPRPTYLSASPLFIHRSFASPPFRPLSDFHLRAFHRLARGHLIDGSTIGERRIIYLGVWPIFSTSSSICIDERYYHFDERCLSAGFISKGVVLTSRKFISNLCVSVVYYPL